MAATITPDGELTYVSMPIEKMEETEDGNIIVYGKCTDDTLDSDLQKVDMEWSREALQKWMDTGPNIRVQHQGQRDPAGVGLKVDFTPDGHYLKALVVESEAKNLVKHGALRAFSVGISRPIIVRDPAGKAINGIIKGDENSAIAEVSLVDRPANPSCGFQLVKSDKSGRPEFTGKMFGDTSAYLTAGDDTGTIDHEGTGVSKSADTVPVDLPSDVSISFSPADLAKLLNHRKIAEERVASGEITEKRKMDPDVGGGVDRDKIPAEDFAGRDRSFPIVTPGDVSDAASSIGRAGADNFSSDQLKRNIIRIARRKGESFVAELPASWKKGKDSKKADDAAEVEKGYAMDADLEKDKTAKKGKGKKPAFPGAAKPFNDSDADGKDESADPDATKKPVKAKKAKKSDDTAEVIKKDKIVCPNCGAIQSEGHEFCSECGKKIPENPKEVKKNHDFMCLGCEKELDKGERFCPGCGKKNPGYLPMADAKIEANKGHNPGPGAGVVGEGAANIKAVPEHREPDGKYVEEFERDLKLEDGDEEREIRESEERQGPALKAVMHFKSLNVPYDLGALHDLTCAAYHPEQADKAHPGQTFASVDTSAWQQKALDMAASAPLDEARKAAQMWQYALTLKNADPVELNEIRDEVHKAFQDANPGPGSAPTPGMLCAGDYKRPYISEGHANPSTDHSGPHTFSGFGTQIEGSDFHREFLTSGHAERSPSNKNQAVIEPAPLPPGMSRTYYRNAQREAARSAMGAMHDHIAQTFPDLCPMEGPGRGGEPAEGSRPVPVPGSANKSETAAVAKGKKTPPEPLETKPNKGMMKKSPTKKTNSEVIADAKPKKIKAGKVKKGVKPAPKAPETAVKAIGTHGVLSVEPDLIKSAVTEATSGLSERLDVLTKELEAQRKKNKKLQAVVDQLCDLPDPREAPFKGLAQHPVKVDKSLADALPAGARTVAEYADSVRRAEIAAMQAQARNSSNPVEREAAWSALNKMVGMPI